MTEATAPSHRLSARVTGRVQGVGYRQFIQSRARSLGLAGWAKNEWDGSVSVVAEGPREGLDELVGWLERGPPLARVDLVDADWEPATGAFSGFGIR
jgi:acylphosphatase